MKNLNDPPLSLSSSNLCFAIGQLAAEYPSLFMLAVNPSELGYAINASKSYGIKAVADPSLDEKEWRLYGLKPSGKVISCGSRGE